MSLMKIGCTLLFWSWEGSIIIFVEKLGKKSRHVCLFFWWKKWREKKKKKKKGKQFVILNKVQYPSYSFQSKLLFLSFMISIFFFFFLKYLPIFFFSFIVLDLQMEERNWNCGKKLNDSNRFRCSLNTTRWLRQFCRIEFASSDWIMFNNWIAAVY